MKDEVGVRRGSAGLRFTIACFAALSGLTLLAAAGTVHPLSLEIALLRSNTSSRTYTTSPPFLTIQHIRSVQAVEGSGSRTLEVELIDSDARRLATHLVDRPDSLWIL